MTALKPTLREGTRSPFSSAVQKPPLLSVVIAFYNEAATLGTVVKELSELEVEMEIILVDDGSTDDSFQIACYFGACDPRIVVLQHGSNCGKGAALRSGFAVAKGTYIVVQDADLEYDPATIPELLQPLIDGHADVVYGSRFLETQAASSAYKYHMLGNRLLTSLSNLITGWRLTDMETCYKVIPRSILQNIVIEEDRFGFEPEITAKLARYRIDGRPLRIREIGICYQGRTFGDGKKITWRDGISAMRCILKYGLLR